MAKILVVDDEPTIVEGIRGLLELHDIEAEGAWDRETAEELIAREFFPVILSDVRMRSDDDGFRLLDAVKRISPRSRVASMTAYADAVTVERLRASGATLVLQKPLTEDELMAALREMLAAVEQAAENADADNDEALYTATLKTLNDISRGRYGFTAEDAQELVQEAWLLFLEKRASVRSPRVWLSGTVANLCRQEIERRTRNRARTTDMPEIAIRSTDVDVFALRQALEKLDERSRMLCTLIGLEQRSYEEVSAAIDVPIGSIGPLYMRAKDRLRKLLESGEPVRRMAA